MLRSLRHYWRIHLAVVLGAATTSAVLSGALLVGDSMRGSLRDLTTDRLGAIDRAVVTQSWFREAVALAMPSRAAVPAILVRGAAVHATRRARAAGVDISGVEERFSALFSGAEAGALRFPSQAGLTPVILNESLRAQLGASMGDDILLSVTRPGEAPDDTVLGRRDVEGAVATLRCKVAAVLPDIGPGRFSLAPRQGLQLNAYVPLADLQRALGRQAQVNTLLVSEGASSRDTLGLEGELENALSLEDRGLSLSAPDDDAGWWAVQSKDFILRPEIAERVEQAARAAGGAMQRVQTNIAVGMRAHGRLVPYSTITAVDTAGPPFEGFHRARDGATVDPPGPGEILLNDWAADDLEVVPGDVIDVAWLAVGEGDRLETRSSSFRLEEIVAVSGLAADRKLTPDYPGIQGAKHMASWNAPFPVDYSVIRPRDEQWWDQHGPTPKAFVSFAMASRLWASRYGTLTSIRIAPTPGASDGAGLHGNAVESARAFGDRLAGEIRGKVPFGLAGIQIRDVRKEGLDAAGGATDFGMLFVAFSSFLIISSALLAGLLFRLGVEQRAGEIGVLLATGRTVRMVQRKFLAEGLVLAAAGALLGTAGGVAYAAALMAGLRTIWRGAVGTSQLWLHVTPASLLIGAAVALIVVAVTILASVWRLGRHPIPSLLTGRFRSAAFSGAPTAAIIWAACAGAAAAGLLLWGLSSGRDASPAISFASGAFALVAAFALFAAWCRGAARGRTLAPGRGALAGMAARNCAWNPGRSLLSVALIGCACFVIVLVAASRHAESALEDRLDSGAGGYELAAETDLPVHQDLNTEEGRDEVGLSGEDALPDGVVVTSFRSVPGDDASCHNLYRPTRPRLLGVPPSQAQRGGFVFQELATDVENPWSLLEKDLEAGVVPAFGDQNSVRWILHLGLGQELTVTDESGRPLRLRFVGLLQGSIFQSEVLVSETALRKYFPSRTGYSNFLIDAPHDAVDRVSLTLEKALGAHGFDSVTTAARLAGYHEVENTYLATFQVLGGLGLLLGTVGLAVVMLRNVVERRSELAAMRAFGFRRSMLAALVLAENVVLLCAGAAAGTLSAMSAAAPRLTSGGTAWFSILATLGLVIAVGMVSSAAAVMGALRAPLLGALKEER